MTIIQSPYDSGTSPTYILPSALTRKQYQVSADTILYQGIHEI